MQYGSPDPRGSRLGGNRVQFSDRARATERGTEGVSRGRETSRTVLGLRGERRIQTAFRGAQGRTGSVVKGRTRETLGPPALHSTPVEDPAEPVLRVRVDPHTRPWESPSSGRAPRHNRGLWLLQVCGQSQGVGTVAGSVQG